MNRLSLALSAILFMGVWLFLGIEEIHREHQTDYLFFVKQEPTFRVIYSNPADCGECDVKPLSTLGLAEQSEFRNFCNVRFGLEEIRECHAIFAESQRMANERLGRSGAQ